MNCNCRCVRLAPFGKMVAMFLLGGALVLSTVWVMRPSTSESSLLSRLKQEGLAGQLPVELLQAAATHGSANLAVATGPVSEEAEGVFFLDYLTGDLQCWVYYPRTGSFSGKFSANVRGQLPSGKNPEYLMATGAIAPGPTTTNTRQGGSLLYVVDVNEGVFAAYAVPWNRSTEAALTPQSGALVPVAGGQIRPPLPVKK